MRVGWCPGGRRVADMLKLYPSTQVVRLFYGFRDRLPNWDGPDLGPLGDALPIVSAKVWDLPGLLALADGIPDGKLLAPSYHHEDEQQDGGDIPPQLWVSRWAELARGFEGHPKRDQIILAPIFTRYWWEKHPGDLRYWPGEVAHLLDAVGWDIYNSGTTYRSPDDLLRVPREMAARTGLPYFIAELGAVRVATDTDGSGRSAWMRAMVDAARADGALAVCWFHKNACDLADGKSGPEQKTWQALTQEVTDVGAQRRLAWINRGSPFRLMTPLAQLRDRLRKYGYTVYDIGNRQHLEHDPPEDHTPYSATGYPGEAQYGVGYAIDIMPPPAGSGLPSLQQLGAQLLADREDGVADVEWLKYMNWEPEGNNTGPCYHESWQPTYARRSSTDRGHIHLSGLTGFETSTIAAGYDPVARIKGEDIMATIDDLRTVVRQELAGIKSAVDYIDGRVEGMAYGRTKVRAGLKGAGAPVAIIQMVKALADAIGNVDEKVAAQLADEFARIERAAAAAPQLDPKAIADAIPAELARQVADELAARLAS